MAGQSPLRSKSSPRLSARTKESDHEEAEVVDKADIPAQVHRIADLVIDRVVDLGHARRVDVLTFDRTARLVVLPVEREVEIKILWGSGGEDARYLGRGCHLGRHERPESGQDNDWRAGSNHGWKTTIPQTPALRPSWFELALFLIPQAQFLHLGLQALARNLEFARGLRDVAAGLVEGALDEFALDALGFRAHRLLSAHFLAHRGTDVAAWGNAAELLCAGKLPLETDAAAPRSSTLAAAGGDRA